MQFLENLKTIVLRLSNAVCKKRKPFAENANDLQKTQTALGSEKIYVRWKVVNNTYEAFLDNIKMYVLFSVKVNTWIWQLGNDTYYERGYAATKDICMKYAILINKYYQQWDADNPTALYFEHISWKPDFANGYIGLSVEHEFWVSPIDEVTHETISTTDTNLWRYDIYYRNNIKSVRSGVAKNQSIARRACVRAVDALIKYPELGHLVQPLED
jgi:hypothetical protein